MVEASVCPWRPVWGTSPALASWAVLDRRRCGHSVFGENRHYYEAIDIPMRWAEHSGGGRFDGLVPNYWSRILYRHRNGAHFASLPDNPGRAGWPSAHQLATPMSALGH